MAHRLHAALAGAIVCAISVPAHAGATDFGYVYTAATEEAGETEVSLWATDRRGKGDGHYDAQDYKLEVERGITDRFGVSAPGPDAYNYFGLTPDKVVTRITDFMRTRGIQ